MSEGNPTPTPPKPPAPPPPSPPAPRKAKPAPRPSPPVPSPVDQPTTQEGLGGLATLGLVLLGAGAGVALVYGALQLAPVRNALGLPPKQKAVTVTKF